MYPSMIVFLASVLLVQQNGFASPVSKSKLALPNEPSAESKDFIAIKTQEMPAISTTEVFIILKKNAPFRNVSKDEFLYFLDKNIYTPAFIAEMYLVGINVHLFKERNSSALGDGERRIAIAVHNLWTSLPTMRSVAGIAKQVANLSTDYLIRSKKIGESYLFMFHELDKAVRADPLLASVYEKELKIVTNATLPKLECADVYAGARYLVPEQMDEVWSNPSLYPLIARARFSQYVQANITNDTRSWKDDILFSHQLVELAAQLDLKEQAQKVLDKAIADAVKKSTQILKLRDYAKFDPVLFASLRKIIQQYPKLAEEWKKLDKNSRDVSTQKYNVPKFSFVVS